MEEKNYTISDQEYKDRWKKVQNIMAQNNCELLLIYGDDHSFSGPANVRYLSDYAPHFEPAIIIMPKAGTPTLVTGPELKDYAVLVSRIRDIIPIREFALPGQEYPFVKLTDLSTAIRNILHEDSISTMRNVGVVGMDHMSHGIVKSIKGLFRNTDIFDAGPWLTQVRMVKSENEIAIIKGAYEIADAGIKACIDSIREGVTEHEIAAAGEFAMRRLGAEGTGMDTVVGSGPYSRPIIARTTDRRVQNGDLVAISIGPRFSGYHGQIGRPFFLGKKIPGEIEYAMQVARQAQELTREALKPGAVGEEVEARGRDYIKQKGLIDYYVYSSCHSVGTAEAEEPVLGPGSRLEIEPNMVYSIDIPLFLAPFGGFRYEDGFLVTQEGAVKLNKTN